MNIERRLNRVEKLLAATPEMAESRRVNELFALARTRHRLALDYARKHGVTLEQATAQILGNVRLNG